jgi:hypothetical protein
MSDAMSQIRKAAEGEISVSEHGTHAEVTAEVLGVVRTYVVSPSGEISLRQRAHSGDGISAAAVREIDRLRERANGR